MNAPPQRMICILAPTRFEFNACASALDSLTVSNQNGVYKGQGYYRDARVVVFETAIRATQLPAILEDCGPSRPGFDLVLVCGLAGALTPSLKAGDVVLYDRCITMRDELAQVHPNPLWLRAAHDLLSRVGSRFVSGSGVTVGELLTSADEKLALGRRFNAQIADMESFDILTALAPWSIPSLVLRSISDEASQRLPDFGKTIDAAGRIQLRELLRVIWGAPLLTARLARGAWYARRTLKRALHCLLMGISAEEAR